MSFPCHRIIPQFAILFIFAFQARFLFAEEKLRVCSDPNNLPFSNEKLEGFENKIAKLIAEDLHKTLEYTWWAQRRGFIRNTLKAESCDLIIGMPSSIEMAATTSPYYQSSYVFVQKKGRDIIKSFDDPRLRNLKVGVQLIGDDFANTPPAHALTNRGIISNIRGYTVYGDYGKPLPAGSIIHALNKEEIDLAVVWGPLAGYIIKKEKLPLIMTPVSPQIDLPFLPFVFDISMAVRREDNNLKSQIEDFLSRRRNEIGKILKNYGIPRTDITTG
jgi:mxaJ protein